MTHDHNLHCIQPLPSLQLFWYDPATGLVFSDGFTAPILPHYTAHTGGLPVKVQEERSTQPVINQQATGKTTMPYLVVGDGRPLINHTRYGYHSCLIEPPAQQKKLFQTGLYFFIF